MAKALEDQQSALHRTIEEPFILDHRGEYAVAVESYIEVQEKLESLLADQDLIMKSLDLKACEKQAKVIALRRDYLASTIKTGQLSDIIKIPTNLSIVEELQNPASLSNTHNASTGTIDLSATNEATFNWSNAVSNHELALSTQLLTDATAIECKLTIETEAIQQGMRQIWYLIRHPKTDQIFWAFSGVSRDNLPITEGTLHRCDEITPDSSGAVKVKISKTPAGAYNLTMRSEATGWTYENPDRGKHKKHWAPRRFRYGDRHFVWKPTTRAWETLYETSQVHSLEKSKTGKKQDEIIGEKLFWGTAPTLTKSEHTIWFKAGLDQGFIEHCLASQLARMMTTSKRAAPRGDRSGDARRTAGVLGSILSFAPLYAGS